MLDGPSVTFHLNHEGLIQQVSGMDSLPKHPLRRLKALQCIRSKAEKEIIRVILRQEEIDRMNQKD